MEDLTRRIAAIERELANLRPMVSKHDAGIFPRIILDGTQGPAEILVRGSAEGDRSLMPGLRMAAGWPTGIGATSDGSFRFTLGDPNADRPLLGRIRWADELSILDSSETMVSSVNPPSGTTFYPADADGNRIAVYAVRLIGRGRELAPVLSGWATGEYEIQDDGATIEVASTDVHGGTGRFWLSQALQIVTIG